MVFPFKDTFDSVGFGHSILLDDLPVGLGGKFELANFQEEEILSFYQTSAPIYRKAFEAGEKPAV